MATVTKILPGLRLGISFPKMPSLDTSGHLQIDLMSASLKCDYAISTLRICEVLTVSENIRAPLVRQLHTIASFDSWILKRGRTVSATAISANGSSLSADTG